MAAARALVPSIRAVRARLDHLHHPARRKLAHGAQQRKMAIEHRGLGARARLRRPADRASEEVAGDTPPET